jgi:hypothetical protein
MAMGGTLPAPGAWTIAAGGGGQRAAAHINRTAASVGFVPFIFDDGNVLNFSIRSEVNNSIKIGSAEMGITFGEETVVFVGGEDDFSVHC